MSNASTIGPADGGRVASPLSRHRALGLLNWAGGVALAAEAATVLALTNGLSLLLIGIRDLAALVAIFVANTATILFGLLMERQQRPREADWSAFWFGSLVGAMPWALVVVHLAAGAQHLPSSTPS